MSQTPSPLPTNIDAAVTVAANASAIPLSLGGMPIATIAAAATANMSTIPVSPGGKPFTSMGLNICGAKHLKLIGTTITNVIAGNCKGSGVAQRPSTQTPKKGSGVFSQLNPLVAAQKAANAIKV